MDRQTKIDEFISALEVVSSSINPTAFEVSSPLIDELVKEILDYVNKNYPAIVCAKEEMKNAINKIDNNIGIAKYDLGAVNADVDAIIAREISKYKTMFMSINAGTNISYLGLVDECTQNVMALLIRKNKSISFAKNTKQVEEYIYNLVNTNFFRVMVSLGDKLLDDGIIPIENDFSVGKRKVKIEEF